ncbi:virulence plasmid A protein [Geodermatophilus amargosae]|uniref:Virulence plasmid A protein n=1 Tax=Geodermatophilus amargosae TaxID=1296565 RepID=A0A1I7D993_9ACTN|nr:virulence plasmid A protein [Geodermatophilus amargosae]
MAGVTVTLENQGLVKDEQLGDAVTDSSGVFEVSYDGKRLRENDGHVPRLVVRVRDLGPRDALTQPAVPIDPAVEASVDIEVPADCVPAEYGRIRALIDPLLGGAKLRELPEERLSVVASVSGASTDAVTALARSERVAAETHLPVDVLYGVARSGLDPSPASLLRLGRDGVARVIDEALRNNLLPAERAAERDRVLEQVASVLINTALRPADVGEPASLGDVLGTVLDDTSRRALVSACAPHLDRPNAIRDAVQALPELTARREEVMTALELAQLTGRHLPMMREFQDRVGRDSEALRRGAALSRAQWEDAVQAAGAPARVSGETLEERGKAYARELERAFEERCPTATLAARIEDGTVAVPEDIRSVLQLFFAQNASFELGEEPVANFLGSSGASLDGIDDVDGLRLELQRLERIAKVIPPDPARDRGPRYRAASALRSRGLDSALKIARVGRRDITVALGHELEGGTQEADAIHAAAADIAGLAMAVAVRHGPAFHGPTLAVIDDATPLDGLVQGGAGATLQALFGTQDYCACDDCEATTSPAAYLVDILQFLGDRRLADGRTAKDILLDPTRRPDIAHIELTCNNTNRRMPYVDLVLELLENAVAPRREGSPYPQTTWTEEELRTAPEHLLGATYDVLRDAIFPWTLPFDLWLDEVRAHLGLVGFSRQDLMEIVAPAERCTSATVARELLGTSKIAAGLMTGSHSSEPWSRWGLDEHVVDLRDTRDGTLVSGAWANVLRGHVSILLQQCGLSFTELLTVLDTHYVNPEAVTPTVTGDACNVAAMQVPWLHEQELERIHRLVRLQRTLAWDIEDVDRAITAHSRQLDDDTLLNDDTLLWISHVERLRTRLDVPVWRLVAWWSTLDTKHYTDHAGDGVASPSSYERVFADPQVLNPPDAALTLDAQRNELHDTSQTITAHMGTVSAALGLSVPDLARLVPGEVPDELKLANLSKLHAMVTLARALRLSVSDFIRVRALCDLPPFPDAGKPSERSATTLAFVEEVDRIRASGFSLDELDYLLRGDHSSAAPIGPSPAQLHATLTNLRSGLQRIHVEFQETADNRGDTTRGLLAQLAWPPDLVESVTAVLGTEPDGARTAVDLAALPTGISLPADLPADLRDKVVFDVAASEMRCLGVLTNEQRNTLLELASSDADTDEYTQAVEDLYVLSWQGLEQGLEFVRRQMQSFHLPRFTVPLQLTAPLTELPHGLKMPDAIPFELRNRLVYDETAHELRLQGSLSSSQRDRLLDLGGGDIAWAEAVKALTVLLQVPVRLVERFALDADTGNLRFLGVMTPAQRDELRMLASAPRYQAAIDDLFAAGQLHDEPDGLNRFISADDAHWLFHSAGSPTERFGLVQRRLLPHLRARAGDELISSMLGASVGMDQKLVREVLASRLAWPGRPGLFARDAFLNASFAADSVADLTTAFPDQQMALTRLHKLALLASRLTIAPPELLSLLVMKDWNWINDLPALRSCSNMFRFAGWRRLVTLVALRDRLPAGGDVLAAVLAARPSDVREVLAGQLGWDAEDLAFAVGPKGLNFQDADFREPGRLAQLFTLFDALRLIGGSASELWAFAAEEPGEDEALLVRRVVRAALGESGWLDRVRVLRDALRERQREALVAYLVAHHRLRDPTEMLSHFLADVEMDPCATTSRIRQATGAVQLFVQRCLLGLEREVPPSAISADLWEWLKSYRVWEANRRVFLYPENWLDPELRDDKTEAFRQLESEVQQSDLTDAAAARAFAGYLQRLEQVARLKVTGTAREKVAGGEILHVIARTYNAPHAYHYRRRTESGTWTGWERINLDIQGDHVVPLVWHGRLFLFWVQTTQEADEPERIPKDPERPARYWAVTLAWSERTPERWTATQELTERLHATFPADDFSAAVLLAYWPWGTEVLNIVIGYPTRVVGTSLTDWTWRLVRFSSAQGPLTVDPNEIKVSDPFVTHGAPAGTFLDGNAFVERSSTGQSPLIIGRSGPPANPFVGDPGGRAAPTPVTVLDRRRAAALNRFRAIFPLGPNNLHQMPTVSTAIIQMSVLLEDGFFFEDRQRTYLATYEERDGVNALQFSSHYHPHSEALMARLSGGGLRELLSPATQDLTDGGATFAAEYAPNAAAVWTDDPPREDVDFGARGAYAPYNWELFFHAPLLIAQRLSRNQRFAEAQQWFHLIFNPTDDSADPEPGRYWRTRPFREGGRPLQLRQLLELLAAKDSKVARVVSGPLADGRLQLWAIDSYGWLFSTWQETPASDAPWTPWRDFLTARVGGPTSGAPPLGIRHVAAAALSDRRLALWAVDALGGLRNTVKATANPDAQWMDWTDFLAAVPTGPARPNSVTEVSIGALSDGRLRLFAIDAAGTIATSAQESADPQAAWTPWEDFTGDAGPTGGAAPEAVVQVAAARLSDGRLAVWAVDGEGSVLSTVQESMDPAAPWRPWTNLLAAVPGGGPDSNGVARLTAAPLSDGRVQLWAVDALGQVRTTVTETADPDAVWTAWTDFVQPGGSGPQAGSPPNNVRDVGVSSLSDRRLQLWITDRSGRAWSTWHVGVDPAEGWADWTDFTSPAGSGPAAGFTVVRQSRVREDLRTQVAEWRRHPFRPHAVARWRISAYQRAVVMAYVDNLIAYGDTLFRRDTPETVNEALQLYVLAASILGPRPERIPRRQQRAPETFATLEPKLDELSNALVEIEDLLPSGAPPVSLALPEPPVPLTHALYFCVPHNPRLLERWDRVTDRLFKIRHCMNIEGIVRDLPLFEPPIDPGLLVRATAAGIDLRAALADRDAALPPQRFAVLVQKATELCADVRALGGALLDAFQRRDAQGLELLRSTHERSVLDAARAVRQQQLEEAKAQVDALSKSLELSQAQLTHHLELLAAVETITIAPPGDTSLADRLGRALKDAATRSGAAQTVLGLAELVAPDVRGAVDQLQRTLSLSVQPAGPDETVTLPLNTLERRQLDELQTANAKQQLALDYDVLAQMLSLLPDITLGTQGVSSPVIQAELGGTLLSTHARMQSTALNAESNDLSSRANLHGLLASHQRRADEWMHQARQTLTEIEQIGKQLVAAGVRVSIATQELRVHDQQTSNARAEDVFMHERFTNQELCDWLVTQISTVYLASYQLAYDVAKRAERAYRYELGVTGSPFIRFDHWDSLRKGLLAGEQLAHDIRRMEVAYLDLDQREHEMVKHVSLAQLDPAALVRLKMTGACEFEIPEGLFDLDRPGHYRRRIKTASLSIPAVTGPYVPVHCTLTLLRSSERVSPTIGDAYPRARDESGLLTDDSRFMDAASPLESIVTSGAQEQFGLFDPQLGDPRRLPFDRRGAISRWRLELPSTFQQFDHSLIPDVVLHLRYTARDGGSRLADAAVTALRDDFNLLLSRSDGQPGLARLFSLRHEFSGWHRLVAATGDRALTLEIGDRFPFLVRDREITIKAVDVLLRGREDLSDAITELRKAKLGGSALDGLAAWSGRTDVLSAHQGELTWNPRDTDVNARTFDARSVSADLMAQLQDVWLICHYTVEER